MKQNEEVVQKREIWPVSKLKAWDKNPRAIKKDAYERLKRQLQKHGQFKPLIITMQGIVIGGNMRLKAYLEMGVQNVWVSIVDPENEAEMVAIALADNDRAGYYEEESLAELIQELDTIDWEDYHLDLGQTISAAKVLQSLSPDNIVEDEVPELQDTQVKLGDIYTLGSHRLMCGSATEVGDVSELMNGQLADLIITDPPYNVDYTGKTKDALKIDNDSMEDGKFLQFLTDSFVNMYTASKDGSSAYIFHADSEGYNFRKAFMTANFQIKQCIIWAKNSLVMGRQDYHWQHEPVLYGWKVGNTHQWHGDRKQTTLWNVDRPQKSTDHPTMKPIALMAKPIHNSSKQGDIILDLFSGSGSGSTLIACEQTGRSCYAMELEPKYCDVILRRWENFTGMKAEKVLA